VPLAATALKSPPKKEKLPLDNNRLARETVPMKSGKRSPPQMQIKAATPVRIPGLNPIEPVKSSESASKSTAIKQKG